MTFSSQHQGIQLSRGFRQSIETIICPELDCRIAPFDMAGFAQASAECGSAWVDTR